MVQKSEVILLQELAKIYGKLNAGELTVGTLPAPLFITEDVVYSPSEVFLTEGLDNPF